MADMPKVAIVGGGIGGAALATSLLQNGVPVKIFERASAFGEVGAGVQITPNAVKVLRDLGLGDGLDKVAFRPEAIIGRNWKTGRSSFSTKLDSEFESFYGAPYVQVHRADLLDLLVGTLPPDISHFGTEVVSVTNEAAGGATIHFADGTSEHADLVVGADGVRSAVQASLFGPTSPRYTGNMCFRALVPTDGVVDFVAPANSVWMGAHGHVVTYYVKSGRAVNIVAVVEAPAWVEEGWNVRSSRQELISNFKDWHPDVLRLFERVEDVFRWGLFDRDPLPAWSKGSVTLLGDAAHPMLPFLSQGAAMAIEDGYVLAKALAHSPTDVPQALRVYEELRQPRTNRVQLESRSRGETYHLPTVWSQARRDIEYFVRSIFAPRSTGIRADWVYEYDAVAQSKSIQMGAR